MLGTYHSLFLLWITWLIFSNSFIFFWDRVIPVMVLKIPSKAKIIFPGSSESNSSPYIWISFYGGMKGNSPMYNNKLSSSIFIHVSSLLLWLKIFLEKWLRLILIFFQHKLNGLHFHLKICFCMHKCLACMYVSVHHFCAMPM